MIPLVAAAGLRVLAPDLIGFGKSDKPAERSAYTYENHVAWIRAWIEALDLKGVTLACQDWGSLIGLRLAAENPDRFDRILLSNGGLPTGDHGISLAFNVWRAFSIASPWFPIGRIVATGTKRRLDRAERAAYDAPFPASEYTSGARVFPSLVPIRPDDPASEANRRAWNVFETWEKPFITCFSDGDPIARGFEREPRDRIPGARGQTHTVLRGGHFIQEDDPQTFARLIIEAAAPARRTTTRLSA